ncbi:MAG: GIY-YIG nuclease family protein [Candidatus Gottesmanbacteria bacterium]
MWYVYLLLCDQKTFYIGITPDIKSRLIEHRSKQSFFTKKFSDIQLMYCEEYKDKFAAAKRERQLKGWSVAKKRLLIEGTLGINRCTELVDVLNQRI